MIFPKPPLRAVITTRAYSTSILNAIVIELASDAPFNVMDNVKASINDVVSGYLMHPDINVVNHIDGVIFWTVMTLVFAKVYLSKMSWYVINRDTSLLNEHYVKQLYKFVDYSDINRQTRHVVFLVFYIFFKNVAYCS
jgi:hypothetical protein